jgi:hypothetical protein
MPIWSRFSLSSVAIVVGPTRLVEQRLRLVEVLLVGRELLLRRHPRALGKIPDARLVEAVAELLEHLVVVEGVAHRPADAAVGEEGSVDVPAEVVADPLRRRRLRAPLVEVVLRRLRRPLLGRERHLVELTGLEGQHGRVGILDDAKADLLEEGLLADLLAADGAPILPPAQHDLLAALAIDDLVGTSADRRLLELHVRRAVLERRILLPGVLVDVLRQHREVDVPDVRGQGLLVEEDDGAVVVGVHPAQLVGATADRGHGHARVHDQPV